MARTAFAANVSGTFNGRPNITAVGPADEPYSGALESAVDANIATLVADGATPTQAHVTTLNTNWTAFKAGPAVSDVLLTINLANVTTRNQLREALRLILLRIEGTSLLTP